MPIKDIYITEGDIVYITFSQFDTAYKMEVKGGIWSYSHTSYSMEFKMQGIEDEDIHMKKQPHIFHPARVYSIYIGEVFTYENTYDYKYSVSIGKDNEGDIVYILMSKM